MILKGASRSGPRQLAVYLMRVERWDTGEPTELLELQSPWAAGIGRDGDREHTAAQLIEAFRDWQVQVEGTRQGRDGLYHAEISPAPQYARTMTKEQWIRSADIMGEELGLHGQPRALVLHDGKDGRMHLHVVWARTDIDTMKVIPDNLNYVAHERASHRLELEFGHEFVPGKHAKRDRKKQPEFPREKFNQAEAQQAARQEIDPEERKKAITALRQSCDDGQAFRNALEQAGYILARGDRRGLVIVDQDGEVLSLSRQVLDIKGKALKEFMADVDPAVLPRVEEAKALQMQRAKAQEEREREEVRKQPEQTSRFVEPPAPQPSPPPAPELQDAELEALKQALAERQAREIEKWADFHAHELRQKEFELDQDMAQHLGLRDTDDRVALQALKENIRERRTGIKGVIDALENRWNPQLAAERTKARRKEIRDLMRRQERERKDYEALLEQTKQLELDNLKAQHARKMQDLAREQEQERERYIREHHEAKRILAELEEERRKLEEELKHNDSLRDGPPPPKLGK